MARESLPLAAWRANKKIPVLLAALLILDVGAWSGSRYLVTPRMEALERHYIERQAEARQSRREGQAPRQPRAELWTAREDLRAFWELIPHRAEFTGLIRELFTLADDVGLQINQISYDPKPLEGRPLLRYGLSFSVSGDYGQIKHFVHALEQSDRLLAVESLSLSGSSEAEQASVSLTLQLSTLFRTGDL